MNEQKINVQNSVLDVKNGIPEDERIFFGPDSGILRVDKILSEDAKRLKEKSEGNTWFTKEIDYKGDRNKFQTLNEDTQRAFKLNIAYQTLMDSGASGGINKVIVENLTSSIWKLLYGRIAVEEMIHSESYSYGLNEVFGSEATKTIDLVYTDQMIQDRMEKENEAFSKLLVKENITPKNIVDLILAIYFLESIKFPFSFLVTFTINKSNNDAIPGFTRTLRLIANDELNVHVPTGLAIINALKNDTNFNEVFKTEYFETKAKEYCNFIVEQELNWAKYLLDGRNVPGLSYKTAEYFIKYQANFRLSSLGIIMNDYLEYAEKNDTIIWFDNYRNIDNLNTAIQESTATSYTRGLKADWPEVNKEKGNDNSLPDNIFWE